MVDGVSASKHGRSLYLASIIMLILLIQLLPLEAIARLYVTGAWLLFVFIDMFDVMWKVQRDEREYIHEAIAERNAAWAMMPILVVGMFIELILSSLRGEPRVNPFIALALIAGVVAKSVTNYRLEKEN